MPKRNFFWLLLVALGLSGMAKPAFGQAFLPHTLKLNPEQLEEIGVSLIQEADQWARFQQLDQALPRARLATQLLPTNAEAWAILGSLYLQAEEVDASLAALEKAQELAPDNAKILFALGSAYFQAENYDRAVTELKAGLDLEPKTLGALFDLGNTYYLMGEPAKAIETYEKAIESDSTFWPAVNNMGLVRYEMGEVEEAVLLWQQAMDLEAAAEPQLALAIALYVQGQQEQGLSLGEAALQLDRRYADLDFLKANLWGERLLADAATFIQIPRIQDTIVQAEQQSPPMQIEFEPEDER
ncbi:MAG: tetratricopeptide repeat protein [Geitlerinemataceae cyanobacterium]